MSVTELPVLSDAIRIKMQDAFQRAAASASVSPVYCSRAQVNMIVDQASPQIIISFGGAAYTGTDPTGDGGNDITAAAPVTVMMPASAAVNLIVAVGKAVGISVSIKSDSGEVIA